jgi:anti-sigma B factor antagonist
MNLTTSNNGSKYTVCINESLTALNSPELQDILLKIAEDADELILDLSGMDYTSSAGLRVLLRAQQIMDEKDADMRVRCVSDMAMEIFEETGFVNLLNIEDFEGFDN